MLWISPSSGCLCVVIQGRLPCSTTVSEHCDWKQHIVIVADKCVHFTSRRRRGKRKRFVQTASHAGLRRFQWESVYGNILACQQGIADAYTHARQGHSVPWEHTHTRTHAHTHIHCIYSTWTCTISGFSRWTKRNRALLFDKGFLFFFFRFLWSFYVVMMQNVRFIWCVLAGCE